MVRRIGTDSNGGVLYEVRKPHKRRARYSQGQTVATESTQSERGAKRTGRDKPTTGSGDDEAAEGESGERAGIQADWRTWDQEAWTVVE